MSNSARFLFGFSRLAETGQRERGFQPFQMSVPVTAFLFYDVDIFSFMHIRASIMPSFRSVFCQVRKSSMVINVTQPSLRLNSTCSNFQRRLLVCLASKGRPNVTYAYHSLSILKKKGEGLSSSLSNLEAPLSMLKEKKNFARTQANFPGGTSLFSYSFIYLFFSSSSSFLIKSLPHTRNLCTRT